jgi:hypothetical protein
MSGEKWGYQTIEGLYRPVLVMIRPMTIAEGPMVNVKGKRLIPAVMGP